MKKYDAIVIGTGVAGITAAFEINAAGKKTAVIEKRDMGGTCAIRGCDPKKILVGASEILQRFHDFKDKGVSGELSIDWPELMDFKRKFTKPVPENRRKAFRSAGIDIFEGTAEFLNENTIQVEGQILEAEYFIIAAGSKPRPLSFPGAEHISLSDEFLDMDRLPESIDFIGGGYVSFELAHVAGRAGSRVRIIHRSERPLKKFDPDLVNVLLNATREMGVEVHLNSPVRTVVNQGRKLIARAENGDNPVEFHSKMLIHGAGRVANTAELNLEKANVKANKGAVEINEYAQSVSNPKVYAAGDCTYNGKNLTPTAAHQAKIAAANVIEEKSRKISLVPTPTVVFTIPTMASVGLTEKEADRQGIDYFVNKNMDTSGWYTSRRIGLKHSGFKTLTEKKTGRIIGAHLLGHGVEETVNIIAMAMRMNVTAKQLQEFISTYPTGTYDLKHML